MAHHPSRAHRLVPAGAVPLLRLAALVSLVLALLAPVATIAPAYASSVTSAVFSGGVGTVSVNGTFYAKQGATLTLTVVTSSDTKCVDVSGAATLPRQTSSTAKSNWTFTTTAPAGNGAQAFTVAASPNFNANNCTGQANSTQASYTLDNTSPVVTAALTPAANAAGWNTTDVTVTWTATDAGAGVAAAQPFQTDTVTSNGIVTKTAPAQSDRLGNTGAAGSVTVRVDKAKPTITATQTKNADGTTTVTFTCSDSNSGGGAASGVASCVADGTSPASASKTVPGGTTVTGTATDTAGNTATASSIAPPSDATPPTIAHTIAPAPNAAGWNKADATLTFACADNTGGSGLKSCVADGTSPAAASKTISTETNGTLVSGTATDNANNTATDSVTVKLDKTAPTISATRAPQNGNANGWNTTDVTVSFTCADAGAQASGVKSCPNSVTFSSDGTNQSVSGTATDNADNSSTVASVTGINIDKTAPSLSGALTSSANSNGWYNGNVTVHWTCTDTGSGLDGACPADSVIMGEGAGLTVSASVSDKAGNTTTVTSAAVNIDRHAPTTGISGTSNAWTNGNVTVIFQVTDNLSGVASTTYTIDGGTALSGTSFTLATEGDHLVTYFSTDMAGNAEAAQTAHIQIDKTAPSISHTFAPGVYTDGAWTNQDVIVTFTCADQGGSGVASCTAPVTTSTEGKNQQVIGTATDNAGNTSTDTAIVSVDKTAPTIEAKVDQAPNDNGWYKDDVTVTYTASDGLSGISGTPANDVLGEGANQSVSATVTDAAGNTASAGVTGINVDKTLPVLHAAFSSGWHTSDVTVTWSCSDALSGVAVGPENDTVTGEGDNLSSTASCTDNAGNTVTTTLAGIQIDTTAPTTAVQVAGTLTNGWHTADVEITLTGSDNLSGVTATYYSVDGGDAQSYTDAINVGAEGTHTITFWSTDTAGNVEDTTGNSITLKLDTTAPTLTGVPTTDPNGNGWYRDDVLVHWTCADTGSGLDGECPVDSTVTGEGDNLSASASIADVAGNSANATVSGIKIDRTAPTTTADVPVVPASGWHTAAVQVTLTGHDALSGIAATSYSVDGGASQIYDGAFSFGNEGTHEITFWSTDSAGNVETAGAPLVLKIDTTAPTTTVVNPISPDSGWFVTSGIPVAFDATDSLSGIDATYYAIDGGAPQTYGQPFTADLSTGNHTISFWSVDLAGNEEAHATTNTLAVNVDTDAPTITGRQDPVANGFGWNNSNVSVTFTCDDIGSGLQTGVAGCAGDATLTNDGAVQSVHGDAVDVAGNHSSADVTGINIDQTKPTLVGVPTDPNGAGWHTGDVTVTWVGDDALSGIDPATQPANSVVTGEGSNLGAGPVTIMDKAGNTSEPATVSGIKIDRTAPVIAGGPTTHPNAAGWYHGEVIIDFTCTDALSGVASCPTSKVIKGDGANQSVTSDPATDVAGNRSAGMTVAGIKIDGTAPTSSSNNQCTASNGYCTGAVANVILTATDQVGLSGVKEIHYTIDGGAEHVAAGGSTTVSVALDGSGSGAVTYWAVDNAGNVETANAVALKWDNIAPTVSHSLSPAANADEWNNSDVTVTFMAKDDDTGSGIASVTTPVKVTTETSGQLVTGSAKDTAGNVGADTVTVRLDKTAPTITGAITSGAKGSNGWFVGPVTVTFTCADALSGVATCPDPVVLTANGTNTASGTVTDKAGNTATATVSGITIDQEKPTLTTATVNVAGGTYTLGAVPAASCTATDSFAGIGSCTVTVSGGNANGVGTVIYTATATDKAGNTSMITGTYKVIYRFDGFLQPINDTAHQVGLSTSVFKAGSTVPVKFQLKKADGTIVQAGAAPNWLTPVRGSAMSAPVDETLYSASPDSDAVYKWDSSAQQYSYNWKSGAGGNYYRIGVTLDDGQTYFVNIGLR